MKTCFLIAPNGNRTDYLLEKVFLPASKEAGYQIVRSESSVTNQILDHLVNSLTAAPMALAYLGSPPWNHNVLVEIGYRLGRFQPLVFLCDEPSTEDQGLSLPFHISDERVIPLPTGDLTTDDLTDLKISLFMRIVAAADDFRSPIQNSVLPVATLQVEVANLLDYSKWRYVESSQSADNIFGIEGELAGHTLGEFYRARKQDTHPAQYREFMKQQRLLIANLAQLPVDIDDDPGDPLLPAADVPIVFSTGRYAGRAYRPVIITAQQTPSLWHMVVLYSDITGGTKTVLAPNGSEYHICSIGANSPSPSPPLPSNRRKQKIFLSYSSGDRQKVDTIYALLQKLSVDPWMDHRDIEGSAEWPREISQEIACCDAALVFLSSDALKSRWVNLEWQALIQQQIQRNIPLMPVRLSHPISPGPDFPFINLMQFVDYETAQTPGYLSDWLKGKLKD